MHQLIAKIYKDTLHTLRDTALWEQVAGANADIEPNDRDRAREKRVRPIIVYIIEALCY